MPIISNPNMIPVPYSIINTITCPGDMLVEIKPNPVPMIRQNIISENVSVKPSHVCITSSVIPFSTIIITRANPRNITINSRQTDFNSIII